VTMLNKRKLVVPSDEEDEAIKAGIAADPDARELTEAEFKQLRPMRGRPMRGRPVESGEKVQMTVRFDTDVIEAFKRAGRC